jgi:hypothetical protein
MSKQNDTTSTTTNAVKMMEEYWKTEYIRMYTWFVSNNPQALVQYVEEGEE